MHFVDTNAVILKNQKYLKKICLYLLEKQP